MKIRILTLLFLLAIMGIKAQPGFEAQNLALDIKHKPGEVIVKFKDEIHLKFTKSNNLMKTGIADVDKAFEKWSVSSSDQLFRNARYERNAGAIRFPDGTEKPVPQFHNIFLLKYPEKFDPEMLAKELIKLEEVEYAEANATAFIHGLIPVSEPFSPDQLEAIQNNRGSNGFVPNDPLFDQQWYLPAVKADIMWETITGNDTEVIAILDTGVDWTHPDLVNKIWQNPNETINSQDTDGNGFVDDIRGWDFVNNDNNPMDDNSHGTHCAGIAAAETNNGIGISGVSWGAKIMPVKVFQSNGVGYVNQIAEGIWYAAQNGATIFSNSWGGYGESITIRLAFEYAYSKGPIIAAAGNSGYKIDHPTPPFPMTAPMFPASYNWVLGVEATEASGWNAWFSNFDPTGPVIFDGRPYGSIFYNDRELNYEVRAPGLSLISTVPNGQYRFYSGTSMATPIVAGAVALMKSQQPELSIEQVFAKLIQLNKLSLFQAGVIDIPNSILNEPEPDLYFHSYTVTDSLGDQDGRIDAGETIGLYVKVKNAGGLVDNVWAKVIFAEFEDTLTVDFIQDSAFFGSVSAYGSLDSETPFTMTTNPNLTDGRHISLQFLIMYEKNNTIDTIVRPFSIVVENGQELKGFYSKLKLTPGLHYIVTEPCFIDTLIVDPGVTVSFKDNMYLYVYDKLESVGKPDSMITYTGANGAFYRGIYLFEGCDDHFEYCIFEYGRNTYGVGYYLQNATKIYHSIFRFHATDMPIFHTKNGGDYRYNVFHNNSNTYVYYMTLIGYTDNANFEYNVLANNKTIEDWQNGVAMATIHDYTQMVRDKIKRNVFLNNFGHNSYDFAINQSYEVINYIDSNYWGSTNQEYIRKNILDFFEHPGRPVLEPINNLQKPPEECHAVVWKVEINDQNPQDLIQQIIVDGTMKVTVYFNRQMDTSFDPMVTFGIRAPFTQNIINDSTSWSSDSTVWTGYAYTNLFTGDGLNTIRVAHAWDMDHFEIPIENERFRFVIETVNSLTNDFIASPGINKITLEWPKNDSLSILGYNLYRFQIDNNQIVTDTILLNPALLFDTIYVDDFLNSGLNYYYMYTTIRTDFTESDFSKVVSATPFGAATGDANGDYVVNILDIITIVSYILNENPQPFLHGAADVNNDGQINLLDIIGVVNIVMNKNSKSLVYSKPAYIFLEENEITLHSDGTLAGLQFQLIGKKLSELSFKNLPQGFEFARQTSGDTLSGVIYSLGNRTLPEGKIKLFDLTGTAADISWGAVFGGNYAGAYVPVYTEMNDSPVADIYTFKVFPNPAKELITVDLNVPEHSSVKLIITDLSGREIYLSPIMVIENGRYRQSFHKKELNISSGVFIFKTEVQPADKTIQPFRKETRLVVI